MRILFALLTLGVGVALLFGGYRLARVVIPLWGFVAGLSVGGSVITAMNDTPFLGTFLGIIVGLVLGALFAVFAYLYYAVAVVVLVGAVGYWLGTNFIYLLGLHAGFISFITGLALGLMFGIIAAVVNAPKFFLISFTAIAGAVATVGSVLLLFNQIPLESFSYSAVNDSLSNSFFWTMAALALTLFGIYIQSKTSAGYTIEAWTMDDGRHQSPPSTTRHAGSF